MWPFSRKVKTPQHWSDAYTRSGSSDLWRYIRSFDTEEDFMEGFPEELLFLPYKIHVTDVAKWRMEYDRTGEWPTFQEAKEELKSV